jgi:hypothetical protein
MFLTFQNRHLTWLFNSLSDMPNLAAAVAPPEYKNYLLLKQMLDNTS